MCLCKLAFILKVFFNHIIWLTLTQGGVSAVSGHMTRKMWGLIPVLDCSQLLRLCPSQCKPFVCPITTSDPQVDSAHRTMSGKTHRFAFAASYTLSHSTPEPGLSGPDQTTEDGWNIAKLLKRCRKHTCCGISWFFFFILMLRRLMGLASTVWAVTAAGGVGDADGWFNELLQPFGAKWS